MTRRCTPATIWASPPTSGSAEVARPSRAPCGSPTAATATRFREHDPGPPGSAGYPRLRRPRVRCPASADGVPILLHDETLPRIQGRPERPDQRRPARSTISASRPSRRPRGPAAAGLPRRGAQERPGAAVVEVLAAGRGRTCTRPWCRRSTGTPWSGSAAWPRPGRGGSTSMTWSRRPSPPRAARVPRHRGPVAGDRRAIGGTGPRRGPGPGRPGPSPPDDVRATRAARRDGRLRGGRRAGRLTATALTVRISSGHRRRSSRHPRRPAAWRWDAAAPPVAPAPGSSRPASRPGYDHALWAVTDGGLGVTSTSVRPTAPGPRRTTGPPRRSRRRGPARRARGGQVVVGDDVADADPPAGARARARSRPGRPPCPSRGSRRSC